MNKRHILALALGAVLTTFLSCSKDDGPVVDPDPFKRFGLTTYFDKSQFPGKVAILGGIDDLGTRWLTARAGGSLSTAQDADIVVVGNMMLDNLKLAVREAYENGKFILVAHAQIKDIQKIKDEYGWKFTLPSTQPEQCMIGFAPHACCLLEPPAYTDKTGAGNTPTLTCFQFMRPLNNFIKRWMQKAKAETKSSIKAPGLNMDDDVFANPFQFVADVSVRVKDRVTYYRVYSNVDVQYNVVPCYLPEALSDKHGDYYIVKTSVAHDFPTAYIYGNNDPEVSVSGEARYFDKEESQEKMKIMGPYKTDLKVEFVADAEGNDVYEFGNGGYPVPATTIGQTTYDNKETFTVDGGISGGYSSSEGGGYVNAELGFTATKENTVSSTVTDLSVTNNSVTSTGNVAYDFKYNNLPNEFQDPTEISKSLSTFEMAWIWKTKSSKGKKDYETGTFPILTKVTSEVRMNAEEIYWGQEKYATNTTSFSATLNRSFADPKRTPVGCLQINNKCSDTPLTNFILYDIHVFDASTDKEVYSTESSVGRDESFEVLLPQKDRTYYVTLSMGASQKTADEYTSSNKAISLGLLKSESDKLILNINEKGGDFERKIR